MSISRLNPTFNHPTYTMDFLKDQMNKASGNSQQTNTNNNNNNTGNEQQESGGFMGKINSAMGGGHSGEKKEGQSSPSSLSLSYSLHLRYRHARQGFVTHSSSSNVTNSSIQSGVDYVQEHFLGGGKQDNESALEQAKDEQISDAIRRGYKSTTGKDFFVPDKE